MPELNEYFDKYALTDAETPSAKQIRKDKAAVMSRIAAEGGAYAAHSARAHKRFRAPLIAAAAAALTLTVGTVSVGAYYNWDFGAILKNWLGSEDKLRSAISEVKVENVENTFDDLDIQIGGALKCEGLNIIFLDITRTDGRIFDMTEYEFRDIMPDYRDTENGRSKDFDDIIGSTYSKLPSIEFESSVILHKELTNISDNVYTFKTVDYVRSFYVKDDDPADNKVTVGIAWTDDSTSGNEMIEVTFRNLRQRQSEYVKNYSGEPVLKHRYYGVSSGKYKADVAIDNKNCDIKSAVISEEQQSVFFDYGNGERIVPPVVEEVYVCPMAIGIKGNSGALASIMPHLFYGEECKATVKLKDGSTVTANSDLSEFINKDDFATMCHDLRAVVDGKFILSEAVDLNDVEAVVINGTEIPVK